MGECPRGQIGRPPKGATLNRRGAPPTQPAYVLHRWDWSETSLILDLFTRDSGRVAVAAKGAKRPTSQLRAVLMPFQRIGAQLGRPRGDEASEVLTLRGAEWGGQGVFLAGAAWFAGFYLNELVMRLLPRDDPQPRLFDAYALAVRALGEHGAGAALEATLRGFELTLLRETGVLPQLDRVTATQAPLQPERSYALDPERGVTVPTGAAGELALPGAACLAAEQALRAMRAPVPGAFEQLRAAATEAPAAWKAQLRQQLYYHLAGATLRTRQVMIDSFRLLGLDSAPTTPTR